METNNNHRNRESPLESEARNTPRRSLKSSVGRAVLKGVGTGLKYLTIMPIVGTYNWTMGRLYEVVAQEYSVVLNNKYGLIKDDQIDTIIDLIKKGVDPVKIYQENKKCFRRGGAKIVGPRGFPPYFKWPFTHPIRVESYPFTLDPSQRQETAIWPIGNRELPISFDVDTRIICQKDPILYTLKNAGRIVRGNRDWEDEINLNIKTECYGLVQDHFIRHKFPEVISTPLDPEKSDKTKNTLLENYGIHSKIKIESIRPSKDQDSLLNSVLFSAVMTDDRTDVLGFIEDITKIHDASKDMGDGAFAKNLDAYLEYKKKRNFFPGMFPGMPGFQPSAVGAS
jgi:hypothetical protein